MLYVELPLREGPGKEDGEKGGEGGKQSTISLYTIDLHGVYPVLGRERLKACINLNWFIYEGKAINFGFIKLN